MNRLIKFSDALCHPVSARRPSWARDGFGDRTREQLAEIGRAFARGDKRTVDQVCEELKATSLRRVGKTFPETFLEGNENSYLSAHLSLKYLPDSVCNLLERVVPFAFSTEAATITVTNTSDSGAGSTAPGARGCSRR